MRIFGPLGSETTHEFLDGCSDLTLLNEIKKERGSAGHPSTLFVFAIMQTAEMYFNVVGYQLPSFGERAGVKEN